VRPATAAETRDWDQLVLANPDGGHILQTRQWGEFKRRWGWLPHYCIDEAGPDHVAVLFLRRRIPGFGSLWYSPRGPGVASAERVVAMAPALRELSPGFLVKIDPELPLSAGTPGWNDAGLERSRDEVQPVTATIMVDLRPSEEEILASFKPKCRYNIRLAARRGVRVRRVPVDDRSIDVMYRLIHATQRRSRFLMRPRDYYAEHWRLQQASGQGEMFFAFLGDEVLAGVFITHLGHKAWYKDGGSTRRHHELMAPHLLQWEVMRWARARGVTLYDLVAVPPPGNLSPDHPFFGLYRFKSGFSKDITEFIGTWDVPLKPLRVKAWNAFGERAARQWSYRIHHDYLY
jgi:serine/alanine adding enzyme